MQETANEECEGSDKAQQREDLADPTVAELIGGPRGSISSAARAGGKKMKMAPVAGIQDAGEEAILAHKKERAVDADAKKLISRGMLQDRVCANLEEREVQEIAAKMEFFTFEIGESVMKQGESGNYFFVINQGTFHVTVNDAVVNTMSTGNAFGGLALLYNCPRTATVKATAASEVWGVDGRVFRQVLQANAQRHYKENRAFLDSIKLFDGLDPKQKDRVGEAFFTEVFEEGARVVTKGESAASMYFVKKGELRVLAGGEVTSSGQVQGGSEVGVISPGECFGERALLYNEVRSATVQAVVKSELLCIGVEQLKEVLGEDLSPKLLQKNFLLQGIKNLPMFSQFSSTQQLTIVKALELRDFDSSASLSDIQFLLIIDGQLTSSKSRNVFQRAHWFADKLLIEGCSDKDAGEDIAVQGSFTTEGECKVAILTADKLAQAMKDLGMSAIGSNEQALDYARKVQVAKEVYIFRHLSQMQMDSLVKAMLLQKYTKGAKVIVQNEHGSTFHIVASGEVTIKIDDKMIRTLGKNAFFGERALLFDQPRTSTVEVSSVSAEIWRVEKAAFKAIVHGKMEEQLMYRINLQDTNLTMKDVRHVKVIGAGAAGVVRLVAHKKNGTEYALKRVKKVKGKVPPEVKRECDLLGENDHPFIMHLVKFFEARKSVYILTELITGGELHAAIRTIPTVLSRDQAQFYAGSLVLALESLCERNIVYRDLKPENVMLDHQGYLKLIDFGIAKKLEEGGRTFSMIGTPHYMAPEIMRGHGYGTEVDIWSLGVILFELVCGYLPFGDDLDDPTEVCMAVVKGKLALPKGFSDIHAKALMQGLLIHQPKKRLGAGMDGYEQIKVHSFFKPRQNSGGQTLFDQLMGRALDPPVVPKCAQYCDDDDVTSIQLSDAEELG